MSDTGVGGWLDQTILELFSNFNDSVLLILFPGKHSRRTKHASPSYLATKTQPSPHNPLRRHKRRPRRHPLPSPRAERSPGGLGAARSPLTAGGGRGDPMRARGPCGPSGRGGAGSAPEVSGAHSPAGPEEGGRREEAGGPRSAPLRSAPPRPRGKGGTGAGPRSAFTA